MKRRNKMKKTKEMLGKYVIVRGNRSGVFAGVLKEKSGSEILLENCRKLWYWDGACAVEQLAVDGTPSPQRCQFTVTVENMEITDALQIIPCTEKAEVSIKGVAQWAR